MVAFFGVEVDVLGENDSPACLDRPVELAGRQRRQLTDEQSKLTVALVQSHQRVSVNVGSEAAKVSGIFGSYNWRGKKSFL